MTKARNKRKILLWIIILAFAVPIAFWFYQSYKFRSYAENFELYISQNNGVKAREELGRIRSFYGRFNQIPLFGWIAEKTIFRDVPIYEGYYFNLIGDYERTQSMLGGMDDYRAHHLLGVADFLAGQAAYQAGNKNEAMRFVESAREHFRSALETGPDDNFDDQWNYHLLIDPKALARALASKEPSVKFILGFSGNDNDLEGPPSGNLLPQGSGAGRQPRTPRKP